MESSGKRNADLSMISRDFDNLNTFAQSDLCFTILSIKLWNRSG